MGEARNVHDILVGKPEENNHSEDPGVDGRIILEVEIGWEGVDWIHLAQDRHQW
jgi:hypothetical protein